MRPVTQPEVAMFAHVACRPEAELDLGLAALVLAEPEYPGLDLSHYVEILDQLGAAVRHQVVPDAIRDPTERAMAVVEYLLEQEQFRGNVAQYDDPRNSFLNEVLDRRLGIPITIAVVLIEVGRRVGAPLQGVSFPGHFLVRAGPLLGPGAFLDPFTGRPLGPAALRDLLRRMNCDDKDLTEASPELQVASKSAILARMLNNLRGIYTRAGDTRRLKLVLDRLRVLEQGTRISGVHRLPQ